MNDITTILNDVSHRPWEIPKGNLAYYQEWNDALFLHFRVDEKNLRELVPAEIELDTPYPSTSSRFSLKFLRDKCAYLCKERR